MTLTKQQMRAMISAMGQNGAWNTPGVRKMGGAHMRMIQRLIEMGLLKERGPYYATKAGETAVQAIHPNIQSSFGRQDD